MQKAVIIIVDDDPAVRDALRFSLTLEGYVVYTCRSGEDLLSHRVLDCSDCVVLDHKPPGLNGLAILRRLAEMKVTTLVIFIAGPVTAALRQQALDAGAALVLEKPLLGKTLTDGLQELMG